MIDQIFPKKFQRYLSLPVLGPLMDSYAVWLNEQQYTLRSSKYELRMAAHIAELSRKDIILNAFMAHLRDNCGYVSITIKRQVGIAGEFLDWLKFDDAPHRLGLLSMTDIEGFIRQLAKRMGRVALQKPISIIRNFLRFLATDGFIPPGLDSRIDTPRVYRQEQLPQSLAWETVQAFLRSIDRDTAIGKRDYAIFSLIITYGLRACDIVALKLDDIKWRTGCIRICQTKTGNPLELPLTNEEGLSVYGIPMLSIYHVMVCL